MCGIAGLTFRGGAQVDRELMRGVLRELSHRGPDDLGWLAYGREGVRSGRELPGDLEATAVLLHRRLSIIDLSEAGWQPMSTPDGRYHIVHNGEIYNYLELREQLARLGVRFRSSSDTEVLLAAYAAWGADMLPRLVGMFAFAVLDSTESRLFLARDFFGIKPLYYTPWRDGFAFASEIKTLLLLPGVSRRIHPQRLYDYLRFGLTDHGRETLFAGVHQLPAAHYLELRLEDAGVPEPRRYWGISRDRRAELSFQDAAARVRDLFVDSVRLHLRSDVPVGAALSGGIDSSSIVAVMRQLGGDALPIHTFSYVAAGTDLDEERWVDLVTGTFGAQACKVRASPQEVVADLDRLIAVQDEPFGGTSIYAQYRVFQLASRHGIKVMLDGQGADELVAGYWIYLGSRLASLLGQGRVGDAARFLRHAGRLPGVQAGEVALRGAGALLPPGLQIVARVLLRRELVPRWLRRDWFAARGVETKGLWQRDGREVLRHHLHQALTADHLPMLLRYEDRNSMAFSIESRVPFLTPDLVSFVFSLPEEYLVAPDATTKAVFREAMRGLIPEAVRTRRDKIGFATPERAWLSELCPWVNTILASEAAQSIPAIDLNGVQRAWEQATVGGRFDAKVWRWINLIRWVELQGTVEW